VGWGCVSLSCLFGWFGSLVLLMLCVLSYWLLLIGWCSGIVLLILWWCCCILSCLGWLCWRFRCVVFWLLLWMLVVFWCDVGVCLDYVVVLLSSFLLSGVMFLICANVEIEFFVMFGCLLFC